MRIESVGSSTRSTRSQMDALQQAELAAAIGRSMSEAATVSSRMTDGFDRPVQTKTAQTGTSKGKAAKKKKSGGGLFGKIAGFLKKIMPIVSKIASFIPGLQAIVKPLEMASSFLNRAREA